MTNQEALKIAKELSVLKFFPTEPTALASLAKKIDRWCEGDYSRARWLVDEGISGMDEYPGPETLRKLLADKFKPAGQLKPAETLIPVTPVQCAQCGDLGSFFDPKAKLNVWCTCASAARLKVDLPQWVEAINKTRMTGGSATAAGRDGKRDEEVRRILKNLTEGYGA